MRFRFILNLFLFIVVVGLALFLFNSKNNGETKKEVLLTNVKPETIDTIKITRPSGEILFKKENGKWFMQSPYHLLANPARISAMLGLLGKQSYTQLNIKDIEPERFKLDKPAVSIQFNKLLINFGDSSPLNKDQRYVMVNDTVHLIADNLYPQLQTTATFFLNNALLEPGSEITAITFPDYTLKRQDSVWKLEPEAGMTGDDIIRMVEAWKKLEAISVRPYNNNKPSGTIKIEMKNHDPLEFAIVSPPPQLILARPELGIQYHISGFDTKLLFPEDKPASDKPGND